MSVAKVTLPVLDAGQYGVKATFVDELNAKITNLITDSKIINLKE